MQTFSVGFLPHVCVVSVLVVLVLMQPDMGTSVVIYATLGGMLFVAGTRTAYLVLAVFTAAPAAILYMQRYPHAWRRIKVFLSPESDPNGAGYQVVQSLVAFGSGEFQGMGLGQGGAKVLFPSGAPHGLCICHHWSRAWLFWGYGYSFGVYRTCYPRTRNCEALAMSISYVFGVWLGLFYRHPGVHEYGGCGGVAANEGADVAPGQFWTKLNGFCSFVGGYLTLGQVLKNAYLESLEEGRGR